MKVKPGPRQCRLPSLAKTRWRANVEETMLAMPRSEGAGGKQSSSSPPALSPMAAPKQTATNETGNRPVLDNEGVTRRRRSALIRAGREERGQTMASPTPVFTIFPPAIVSQRRRRQLTESTRGRPKMYDDDSSYDIRLRGMYQARLRPTTDELFINRRPAL